MLFTFSVLLVRIVMIAIRFDMKKNEVVILLHGIGMSRLSMYYYQRAIEAAGYITINIDYPSRRFRAIDLFEIVSDLVKKELSAYEDYDKVHYVGHSLGGILARLLALDNEEEHVGCCIALGSPNRGSVLAYRIYENWFMRWYFGVALPDLFPDADFICSLSSLPKNYYLIAGTEYRLSPFGFSLEKPNDGTVLVREMIPEGLNKSHIYHFNVSHTSMLFSKDVRAQIVRLLDDNN